MPHPSSRSRLTAACRQAEIQYIAESERDAEALGCQTGERVIVRPAARTDSSAIGTSETSETFSPSRRLDASDAHPNRP
jgi:hypothetical protein